MANNVTQGITGGLTGMLPKVSGQQLLNWVMMGLVLIIALGIIGYVAWYFMKKKKYSEFIVRIVEEDSHGNIHETDDRAGIFLDKRTGFRLFFLEKAKKGLNPNKVPYITRKVMKGLLIKKPVIEKIVQLRRIGVSNYTFIHPKLDTEGLSFTQGEEDMNWGAQELEKIRRTFGKENIWSKLAPYIMFIVTIMIIMIILISLFNKFEILKEVSRSMLEITKQQQIITELLHNTTQSPAINQGMPIIVPGGG